MKTSILIITLLLYNLSYTQVKKLEVEPNHSTIGFKISIAGFSKVVGKFTDYKLFVDWDDTNKTLKDISTDIQVSSIDTGIDGRDDHLRTADFFDAEQFPLISFKTESIEKLNDSEFIIHGKLSMHGVTEDFKLPLTVVKIDGNTIGFTSLSKLNRLDYGVGSEFKHSSMPDFLSDEIELEIYFWTKKRKE